MKLKSASELARLWQKIFFSKALRQIESVMSLEKRMDSGSKRFNVLEALVGAAFGAVALIYFAPIPIVLE